LLIFCSRFFVDFSISLKYLGIDEMNEKLNKVFRAEIFIELPPFSSLLPKNCTQTNSNYLLIGHKQLNVERNAIMHLSQKKERVRKTRVEEYMKKKEGSHIFARFVNIFSQYV
jgi:hypothetical protein